MLPYVGMVVIAPVSLGQIVYGGRVPLSWLARNMGFVERAPQWRPGSFPVVVR
jgi:hypothetical protein